MYKYTNKFSTDEREVTAMQKLLHKWPDLEERGRFVLALFYTLLATLTLILAAAAPYSVGGH